MIKISIQPSAISFQQNACKNILDCSSEEESHLGLGANSMLIINEQLDCSTRFMGSDLFEFPGVVLEWGMIHLEAPNANHGLTRIAVMRDT
jgi:hypothetical protein